MIEGKTLAYDRPMIRGALPSGADLSCEMIRQGHAEEWRRYSRRAYEDC